MQFRRRNKQREVADAIAEHLDTLFRVARRLTGNSAEAEDLVQDTCLRAYEAAASLRHTRQIKHWLVKILTHRHIDAARQRARCPKILPYDEDEASHDRHVPWAAHLTALTPEHLAMQRETLSALKRALDELPEVFRLAVFLVYVEGFSYQEAAEILDCPVGTVMSRLSRGKSLLRQRLCALEAPQSRPSVTAPRTPPGTGRVPLRVVSRQE